MKTIFIAIVACAGLTTGTAFAEPSTAAKSATEQAAPAKATPNPDRRYCFKDEVTGSRLPVKTCRTRAEWVAQGVDMTQFDR